MQPWQDHLLGLQLSVYLLFIVHVFVLFKFNIQLLYNFYIIYISQYIYNTQQFDTAGRAVAVRAIHHLYSTVEQCWLRVNVNSLRLVVGTAYRQRWQAVDLFLDAVTDSVTVIINGDKIILLGDLI